MGKYWLLVVGGVLSGLSCVIAVPFGLGHFLFGIRAHWFDPVAGILESLLGVLVFAWGAFFGWKFGLKCRRQAIEIRLAREAARKKV